MSLVRIVGNVSRCRHELSSFSIRWRQSNDLIRNGLSLSRLRCFSTSSSKESDTKEDDVDGKDMVWLYKRTPNQVFNPRLVLGISTFHTMYWTWYVLDFVPAVNQAPLSELHIDPVIGYVGLFFAGLASFGSLLYPFSLVSRIGLQPSDNKMCVFGHTLPSIMPSETGVAYDIGEVIMDPSSQETKRIVENLDCNLGAFQGMLALKAERRRLPYLLQIRDSTEILDSSKLIQILLYPDLAKRNIALERRESENRTGRSRQAPRGRSKRGRR